MEEEKPLLLKEIYKELEKRGIKINFNQEGFDKRYKEKYGRKEYNTVIKDGFKKPEHRVVWEEAYGKIPPGMIIHHKNGDSKDNQIENLQLVTFLEHMDIHKRIKKLNKN